MRFATVLLAALLLALGVAHALPVAKRDVIVGAETVTVAEASTATGEQFTTTLRRVEHLLAGANNDVDQGTRDVRVTLVVDVNDDGSVTLNGEVVPVGRSKHTVPAVVTQSSANAIDEAVEVTVEIEVTVKDTQTPFGFGRLYEIKEHITELDGTRVFETGMRQWTVAVKENGEVVKFAAAIATFNDMIVRIPVDGVEGSVPADHDGKGHHKGGKQHHKGGKHDNNRPHNDDEDKEHDDDDDDVAHDEEGTMPIGDDDSLPVPPEASTGRCTWFRRTMHKLRRVLHHLHEQFDRLPLVLRLIVAFCFGAFTGYVLLKTLICIAGGRCKGCKCSGSKGAYDANLQAYALQYTALPTDEKDELKKEKAAEAVVV